MWHPAVICSTIRERSGSVPVFERRRSKGRSEKRMPTAALAVQVLEFIGRRCRITCLCSQKAKGGATVRLTMMGALLARKPPQVVLRGDVTGSMQDSTCCGTARTAEGCQEHTGQRKPARVA